MIVVCFPVVATRETVPVGAIVAKALRDSDMSQKEAWIHYGDRDGSRFTRALQGQQGYSLDLWKLVHLPARFWLSFLPALMQALVSYWFQQQIEDVNVLRRTAAVASVDRHLDRLDDVGRARPVRASLDGDQREPAASRAATRV